MINLACGSSDGVLCRSISLHSLLLLMALSRKSELRQRLELFRWAAWKWIFTGDATVSRVWCCKSEIIIYGWHSSGAKLSHSLLTPSSAKGVSIIFYLGGERKKCRCCFSSLALPTLILFMFVMPSSFISSANSARSPPFLWKAEARYFHCCNSFNSTQPRWTLKVNAAVITGDFEQYSPRNSSPEHLLDLNPFGSLFFFFYEERQWTI